MTTKPNLKRLKTLKVPLNDIEDEQLRQFCGAQVAPVVRDIVFSHIQRRTNRTAEKQRSGWPRHGHSHGHVQRFPGRAVVPSGFRRLHL